MLRRQGSRTHYIHHAYSGYAYNRVVQARKRDRALRQTLLLFICLIGVSGVLAMGKFGGSKVEDMDVVAAHGKQTAANPPAPVVQEIPVDTDTMSLTIEQIIAEYPDVQIGVAITDLKTGQAYNYGVQEGFLGASTAKLVAASLFLHEVEKGTYTLQTVVEGHPASYQLQQLIEESDNDSWMAFIRLLKGTNIQAWATGMGLVSYDHNQNILGSSDMAKFLSKLYQREVLSETNTKLLLSHMANANRNEFIVSAVPPDAKVYHKAGWLHDRIHDAAIIDDGKNPYVLVIFTKTPGTYDQVVGEAIFRRITEMTTTTFIREKL